MLVYIKPLSTFPKLHSDTLFGALTSAVSELYPDKVEDMLNEFKNNNPPFFISSTFPVIFRNAVIRYIYRQASKNSVRFCNSTFNIHIYGAPIKS